MDPIFKKLNFKEQAQILVLHAPDSFQPNLEAMQALTSIHTQMEEIETIEFVLAFVTQKAEISQIAPLLAEKANGDLLLWFAYPKKSSKNYQSDINRDDGWTVLGALGFEGVRQVAIDADWIHSFPTRRSSDLKSVV